MQPAYLSAFSAIQREVQEGKHTYTSLGDFMNYLERDAGRERSRSMRSTNEEAATATAGLQDSDWTTQIHKRRYVPILCCPPPSPYGFHWIPLDSHLGYIYLGVRLQTINGILNSLSSKRFQEVERDREESSIQSSIEYKTKSKLRSTLLLVQLIQIMDEAV